MNCGRWATPAAGGYTHPSQSLADLSPAFIVKGRHSCCHDCGHTHVAATGVMLVLRSDTMAVIGEALSCNASRAEPLAHHRAHGTVPVALDTRLQALTARAEQTLAPATKGLESYKVVI